MSLTPESQNSYRADIDGLRALAVTVVVFYHADFAFRGGFVGVDIFFVISGYLIISILQREMSEGQFSILAFWERRVRRLVPALFVSTLVTALLSYLVLLPEDLVGTGGALVALPLCMVNVFIWRRVRTGYFGHAPESRPLLHTWSLGVEEQFYLGFPLLLYILHRVFRLQNQVPKVLVGLGVCSLALCVKLTPDMGGFAFFCLPTRAWEFLLGGLAALVSPPPWLGRIGRILSWSGMVLILASLYLIDEQTQFPGYAAILPVLGTALLLWFVPKVPTALSRLLSWSPVVFIGKISYSVYLWHWPLFALAKYLNCLQTVVAKLVLMGLAYFLGYLSFRFVEQPFRAKKWLSQRTSLCGAFFVQALVLIVIGAAFVLTNGYSERFSSRSQELAQAAERYQAYDVQPRLSSGKTALPKVIGQPEGQARYLLLGDSHAMSLSRLFDELGRHYGVSGWQITSGSTPPVADWGYTEKELRFATPAYKKLWVDSALEGSLHQPIDTVFLVGYWYYYAQAKLPSEIKSMVDRWHKRGIRVVLVGDAPRQSFHVPRTLALADKLQPMLQVPSLTTATQHQADCWGLYQAAHELQGRDNFEFLDLAEPALRWNSLSEGTDVYYMDNNHLAYPGTRKLRFMFEPAFQRLARSR